MSKQIFHVLTGRNATSTQDDNCMDLAHNPETSTRNVYTSPVATQTGNKTNLTIDYRCYFILYIYSIGSVWLC